MGLTPDFLAQRAKNDNYRCQKVARTADPAPCLVIRNGCSCEIFHPLVSVDLDRRNKAFQYLVAFETGKNNPRCETQIGGNESRWDDDEKHENTVVFKDKGGVSAAF